MPPRDEQIEPGPDTLSILLTTDNHVGYLENDPIRGDDSWKTFHEVTTIAKEHDVDMIVQGGDLFHVSKPSKKSLFHVIQSLRMNCLGDRPCELELLSDPSLALHSKDDCVNYEDPNLNVSVPVFAISGNHDDASGEGLLLPLDVMAATGLINYFGQIPQQDKITVTPLVFQKGSTKFALYGINNLRDERLQRIMRNGDVTFQRPALSDDFFNLLCIHQNHSRHSMTSFVPEDFLPSFLDFVFWGHEHECIPYPQYNPATTFDTLQAGSSIATSLSEGECAQKYVFILNIKGKEYLIKHIPLQTVRPFVMKDVSLKDEHFVEGPSAKADILDFLVDQVHKLIEEAKNKFREANEMEPNEDEGIPLPLVRLRVDHSGDYEIENSRRFSNKFVGSIANVDDILLYHKKKSQKLASIPQVKNDVHIEHSKASSMSIQHILKKFLEESKLNIMPEDGMFDITKKFIQQDDKQIFTSYVDHIIANASNKLAKMDIDDEEFHGADDAMIKRSFQQLLTKLRMDSKRDIATTDDAEPKPDHRKYTRNKSVGKSDSETKRQASGASGRRNKTSDKSTEVVFSDDDFNERELEVDLSEEDVAEQRQARKRKSRPTKAKKAGSRKEANTSTLDDIINLGN